MIFWTIVGGSSILLLTLISELNRPYYTVKQNLSQKEYRQKRQITVFLCLLLFSSWYRIVLTGKEAPDVLAIMLSFFFLIIFRFFIELKYASFVALYLRRTFHNLGIIKLRKNDERRLERLSNIFKLGYIYHISTFVSMVSLLVILHPNIGIEFATHFNSFLEKAYLHLFIGYFLSWIYLLFEENITILGYKTFNRINKFSFEIRVVRK